VLAVEVVALEGVLGEVEELAGGGAGGGGDFDGRGEAAGAEALDEFPAAFADSEEAIGGVVDEVGADGGGALFAGEGGEKGKGIFGGVGGKGEGSGVAGCGEEIGVADGDIADGAGFDAAGPAEEEGDAVAGFVGIGFLAAPEEVGPVAAVFFHVAFFPRGAVVAGDDDEGAGGLAGAVDGGEDLADGVVELFDEIAVEFGLAAAEGRAGGDPGGVWGGQGNVAEIGAGFFDELDSAAGEAGEDFVHGEIGGDGAAAPVGAAFEVEIGGHVEGGGDAEVFVEAMVGGGGAQFVGVVDGFGGAEAEVPFAEAAGAVAGGAEQGSDGGPARFDEAGGFAVEDAIFEAGAPAVAAREEAVTGGGADARGGVGIGEPRKSGCRSTACADWLLNP